MTYIPRNEYLYIWTAYLDGHTSLVNDYDLLTTWLDLGDHKYSIVNNMQKGMRLYVSC